MRNIINRKVRNYNSSRVYLEKFLRVAAEQCERDDSVLDAGAGDRRHSSLFKDCNYIATDLTPIPSLSGNVNFISNLASIPVLEDYFDLVICNQVLEHIPESSLVLSELFRVLKKGGELWLTAPFYFEEHEIPNDFYRFTKYGLRYLLEKAGFEIMRLEWLEGYYGTLSYELRKAARFMPTISKNVGSPFLALLISLLALVLKPTFYILSLVFSNIDLKYKETSIGHGKNIAVVAVKPLKLTE